MKTLERTKSGEKIEKFLNFTVEKVAGEERTYWFIASTADRDRMGDVVVQEGWRFDDFMQNPVILWVHNYYSTPIGKAKDIKIEGGKLKIKVEFVPPDVDPFAERIERLVDLGFLRTTSVGFIAYKSEPLTDEEKKSRPEMQYGRRLYGDLLELSIVPVPANPKALREKGFQEVLSKGFGENPHDEIEMPAFLSYKDANGKVNGRKLRACVAALAGARGGVKISDESKQAALEHLYKVAEEAKVSLPECDATCDLKKEFEDVFHEELLDVLEAAKTDDAPDSSLIKGKAKAALVAARKAIDEILALEEVTPEPEPTAKLEPTPEQAAQIAQLQKDLDGLQAALK